MIRKLTFCPLAITGSAHGLPSPRYLHSVYLLIPLVPIAGLAPERKILDHVWPPVLSTSTHFSPPISNLHSSAGIQPSKNLQPCSSYDSNRDIVSATILLALNPDRVGHSSNMSISQLDMSPDGLTNVQIPPRLTTEMYYDLVHQRYLMRRRRNRSQISWDDLTGLNKACCVS